MKIFLWLSLIFIIEDTNAASSSQVKTSKVDAESTINYHYHFAAVEFLAEQEIGRIVLTQVYKNIGLHINIIPWPGKRAQYVANSGLQDGEIMRIWTYGEENPNSVRVPTPYYSLETMPFVLRSSGIVISAKEDLATLRLAIIRGVKHTNNITKGFANIYQVSSTEEMFNLLHNGKVDVVLTNTIDGELALNRLGFSHIISMKEPLARLSLYHYVNEKHRQLVPRIDQEIQRMKSTGELTALIAATEQRLVELHSSK